jgi:hypothetical protein
MMLLGMMLLELLLLNMVSKQTFLKLKCWQIEENVALFSTKEKNLMKIGRTNSEEMMFDIILSSFGIYSCTDSL